ncbi:MAG: putative capsular polysaccharide synthesis family protein [Longimicrobiales bacterium]
MQRPELAVFKTHRMNPERIASYYRERRRLGEVEPYRYVDDLGLALHDEIIRRHIPVRIVTLVREPIARNVSAYFHILEVLWQRSDAYSALSTEELTRGFLERGRHIVPLEWFDQEFRPVTDLDVYSTPFPAAAGCLRLRAGPHDVLVLRADLDDAAKAQRLAEWLGLEDFELMRMNEAGRKHYAGTYAAAIRQMRLPPSYVDEMLESRYARHFFSAAELMQLRAQWVAEEHAGGSRPRAERDAIMHPRG